MGVGGQTAGRLRSSRGFCPRSQADREIIQIFHQPDFHFLARHDGVNQAVFEEEFSRLKTWRQFRLRGVFDDPRCAYLSAVATPSSARSAWERNALANSPPLQPHVWNRLPHGWVNGRATIFAGDS
jgi:hypothetical protein